MGIQGLLPLLKSIMLPIHIKDLEGCSVAVDTYSWLHKGALSCSRELCKGLPTTRHIEYCMHRVNLLRHYGVKPILVFDGGLLPMKMEQENKRARARKENLARALECESNGNSSGAYEFYQKAVDISPSIAHELIQVLKQENVSYVVAPYEADAQMTFLAVSKQVDAIVTEDSDLIPFGCPRIIFKMDKFGEGVEFEYSRLDRNKDLSFTGFSKQMLLEMCILSGCDYLQSLPGMGLKRAHALISKFKCYTKVIKHLRYSTISVPPQYEESFKKAVLTFQHQRVYDPITEEIIHLSDVSDDIGNDLDFLGPSISQHIATGIAKGDIDPITKLPFQEGSDGFLPVPERKFEVKSFKLGIERKKLELPVQKNVLTKYFCFASLEAKRKFMAPRLSPKLPSPLDTSPPSPRDHVTIVDGICEMNCSTESTPLYESVVDIAPHNNLEINDSATEVPELSHSPSDVDERSPEHNLVPIHKPCLALKKERGSRNSADTLEGKSRKENRKVIIRSHYFQHKQVNKNDKENKQEKLVLKDDITIDQENKHEKLVLEGDFVTDISEDAKPGSEFSRYSYLGGTTVKRKISTRDIIQNENVRPKQNCADEAVHNEGYCDPTLEKNDQEMKRAEGKFSSNISHIGCYSEIAEKSVERFVSVISNYRLSSSGSRASGLRAPLRDVRNTRTNRSSAAVDFSQFAYVPKKRKLA